VRDYENAVAAVLIDEPQPLAHPLIQAGRRVFADLAYDMLAVAEPADVGRPLGEPDDLAAILAGEARARH
jgi:hypothetical protein